MLFLRKLGVDGFLLGLFSVVLLAWLYPHAGARGGLLRPHILTTVGIGLVFFLNGARLPSEVLAKGARRWRMHLLIQSFTFVAFPLLGLGLLAVAERPLGPALATGLFFLCALPSTITSSVALISTAAGDVPLGLFNATLSTTLGVVLTPLWLAAVTGNEAGANGLMGSFIGLLLLVIMPLVVGHLLRRQLRQLLTRIQWIVKHVDRGVILLLVYTAFCNSFQADVWSAHDPSRLLAVSTIALLVFVVMLQACSRTCLWLGVDTATKRSVVLCGCQKSLAVGVPMAQVLYGSADSVVLILLPLMIYHPLQLALSSWLVQRWNRHDERKPSAGLS